MYRGHMGHSGYQKSQQVDEENEVADGDPNLYGLIPVLGRCIPSHLNQTMPSQITKVSLQQEALSVSDTPIRLVLGLLGLYKDIGSNYS